MEYRRKAAEEARKAAEEAAKNDPNRPPEPKADAKADAKKPGGPRADVPTPADTLTKNPADTTVKAPADTTPAAPDTSKIAFLWGSKRVRLFRRDLQMAGDSLTYTDLDSLVRLYQDPIFYNEGNRQYAADSIYMVIKGKQLQKAHLLSNAFITIQEDPHSYDQIRGAEMVAYFDSTSALTRFDALGGAASLFYLEEKGALATVNKVETKMIYATFKDGEIERMFYYDNPKNDGYPTVQLPQDDKQLKGFRWEPERRPASPLDVTTLVPRPSERTSYLARPHTEFRQTNDYFPGYIRKVYRDIAIRDSLAVVRQREEQRRKELEALAPKDTVAVTASADTLAQQADTLANLPAAPDSLAAPTVLPDSLAATPAAVPADTLSQEKPLTRAQLRALEKEQKKAERERLKAQKQAEREAKWAEKDRIHQEKQEAKRQKKLEKERARKLKALRKLEKKAQKERALFEKYLKRERERALKKKH